MEELRLLAELLRERGTLERPRPATGKPLERGKLPAEQESRLLVAACRRACLQLFEDRASSIEVSAARQKPGQKRFRALDVLEPEPEALLDLDSPLEEAGSDLGGVHLVVR